MSENKKDFNAAEEQMKRSKMIVGEVTIKIALTKDDINAVLYKPKSKVARNFKKQMNFILQCGAKKLEEDSNTNVKNLKD